MAPKIGFTSTVDALAPAGLSHMGARDYDPSTGTFLSRDPWARPDGMSWVGTYAYTDGNPVSYWDPTGWSEKEVRLGSVTLNSHQQDTQLSVDFTQHFPGGYTGPVYFRAATTSAQPLTVTVYGPHGSGCGFFDRLMNRGCDDEATIALPGAVVDLFQGRTPDDTHWVASKEPVDVWCDGTSCAFVVAQGFPGGDNLPVTTVEAFVVVR